MPDIDPSVIIHRLNIDPSIKSVKQKRQTFNAKHYIAIHAEVDKLLQVGFVRPSTYPEWIVNLASKDGIPEEKASIMGQSDLRSPDIVAWQTKQMKGRSINPAVIRELDPG